MAYSFHKFEIVLRAKLQISSAHPEFASVLLELHLGSEVKTD